VLSEHALSRALEGAGLSAPVRFEEVTRSTQETAARLAEDGAPEWTLVAAGHQTDGRGRLGRSWEDEPGSALLFSIVLRPSLLPELGGLLSLLAGAAMAEACEEVADQRAACKWPNDVLVAGRKAGGILAESRLTGDRFEFVTLGVGVNLGSPPSGMPEAGAVHAEDADLLAAFLRAFAGRYEPGHPAFARTVVAAYRTRCATLGTPVRARTGRGTVVEGEAVDVDETGALMIRVGGGLEAVRFGEVEHLE
jgi:BirA family transcriptional regulator, biotin operon repressor / biotin---[acetyl-CoA-carboxylase] ligase